MNDLTTEHICVLGEIIEKFHGLDVECLGFYPERPKGGNRKGSLVIRVDVCDRGRGWMPDKPVTLSHRDAIKLGSLFEPRYQTYMREDIEK